VSDFNIGTNPVVSLIVGRNSKYGFISLSYFTDTFIDNFSSEIFFTDTVGNVFSVDIRTGT